MMECLGGDETERSRIERNDERINRRIEEMTMEVDEDDNQRTEEGETAIPQQQTEEQGDSSQKGQEEDSMMIGGIQEEAWKMLGRFQSEPTQQERMRREQGRMEQALAVDVTEIFSPPRVTVTARNWGFRTGEAMDLTTGWDFNKKSDQDRAWRHVQEYKTFLVIGSPCCTMFSQLQGLNKWGPEQWKKYREGVKRIEFLLEIYRHQMEQGRIFLHEHPLGATSWKLPKVEQLMRDNRVFTCAADQCMYGLTTRADKGKRMKAKKPTRFLTNGAELAKELRKRCNKRHEHQHLIGGRAAAAAKYPEGLCRAICAGLMAEIKRKTRNVRQLLSLKAVTTVETQDKERHDEDDETQQAWDDLTGEELDTEAVKAARKKEIGYIDDKKVWKKILKEEAVRQGWKIIQTRWIDVNKGDIENPEIRCRLVAKEFNTGEQEGLFAATPPLEALRLLVSDAATVQDGRSRKVIMINDVARAFFEAPMKRTVCVELPWEALTEEERTSGQQVVGLLQMSLYGTRDAAINFQAEVGRFMSSIGFKQGKYNPCTYHHKTKDIKTMVHGDDFVSTGNREGMDWLKRKFRGQV